MSIAQLINAVRSGSVVALTATFVSLSLAGSVRAAYPGNNDNLFPPAPAARRAIDFDGRGFLINGKRTFIAAGDMHYSRIPRAMWRDRLLRLKRAGYNTVQTYVFWNFHENKEGVFDFSGNRDLGAYLDLIHSLGMYAILRIGPYVNSEWDSGGWPIWLRFKPGLVVRDENQPFYHAMDDWFGHLMPVIAPRQINHGGPVILVQLENEDPRGAGTDLPNPYFVHLRKTVVSLGLQVPYFFSGLNHSSDPAGNVPLDTAARTSPWYTSEFWTGWIRVYGEDPTRSAALTRATWKVIAYGGNGYSHYTMVGGSNFDHWACSEQGANYDFGAPIGQAGDLRDDYYTLKLAATFATTFPDILENSQNSTARYQDVANNVTVTARTSPNGTLLFLDNPGSSWVKTQLTTQDGVKIPSAGPVSVGPGELMPVLEDYHLAPGIVLSTAAVRILTDYKSGSTTTLIVYGPAGDFAQLRFKISDSAKFDNGSENGGAATEWRLSHGAADLNIKFGGPQPTTSTLKVGGSVLRVISVLTNEAERTWPVATSGEELTVIGPDYVGETTVHGNRLLFNVEQHTPKDDGLPSSWLFLPHGSAQLMKEIAPAATPGPRIPRLSSWTTASGAQEAAAFYPDKFWLSSAGPLPMGADGDPGYYAWYRTTVSVPKGGTYGVDLSDAGDWVSLFANGQHQESSQVQQRFQSPVPRWLGADLHAGVNQLTFLTAHYGRAKLHAYIGPVDQIDRKGIGGPVSLATRPGIIEQITSFREKDDDKGPTDFPQLAAPALDTSGSDWHDATIGDDVFHGRIGYAWFRASLPDLPYPGRTIRFQAVDDNAVVYVNGKQVVSHQGYNTEFDAPIDAAWNVGGPNEVSVLVQNTYGGGGIEGTMDVECKPFGEGMPIQGWKMRGGLNIPVENSPLWRPYSSSSLSDGSPAFYNASFFLPPYPGTGPKPVLRFSPTGLSRGVVYLNGHGLGRYPEMSAVSGLYFPDSFLHAGANTVTVFDEDGASPMQSSIIEETVATRTNYRIVSATSIY